MNILHYSLGLPPYRTGGLTKYSFDLMKGQARNGDKVYLLFPGTISVIKDKTRIKYYKNEYGINTYEIINPLPVPLLHGISEPQKFMEACNKIVFENFLIEKEIQIVHIHTLMGLHKEFLEACSDLNIKKVYTTHDYFGLCTKVNYIDNEGALCEERNLEKCLRCNKLGYSSRTIMMLQSPVYRFLKNKGIVSKLKPLARKIKRGNNNISSSECKVEVKITQEYKNSYNKLIEYYNDMFNYIDTFLFNSTISQKVYNQYIKANGEIISITHGDIKDNRKIKTYDNSKLKLTYLGPDKKYKGFNLLIDTMKELNKEYKSDVELNLYGDISERELDDNINIHGRYSYDQLSYIFDNTDLLIVPSIWNETFGFITLEALSFGVPVLITSKVGSKDIVCNDKLRKGIITKEDKFQIRNKIIEIINDRQILININKTIVDDNFEVSMYDHYKKIDAFYKNVLGECSQ
ncbi:glycosyltransferase [Inconstantimicrobium mannanitabidum]|uniref:Glycosyl transferase family 1 n=1 Tax=Inconstantimicrobium mannanitabidum TaxID=1604901 RepID=A0ACB5REE0_9CLOT|nr:glycosyltransferase [Clostridium sp. TW13]GKX67466.1 glycosyl transferase family 1 [Clostridium sp. TW13]